MADKKLPKHKRLYSDSPKLERGEDGNIAAKKPSESQKKSDAVQSGTDGESDMEPHEDARVQEIKDMHKRHETEMKAIHSRHEKEDTKMHGKGDSNEKPDAGKDEIQEVEKDKKIAE